MYDYQTQKAVVFTDQGQRMLLQVRDMMNRHCKESGAVNFEKATEHLTGNSWDMIACVDRLIEIGEFECIWDGDMTQNRIYRKK